jgi:hypothetical protein
MKGLGDNSIESDADDDSKPLWREILEVLGTLILILVVLQLLLGAHMPVPIVAVVSCSMIHEDDVIGSLSYKFADSVWPMLLEGRCKYDSGINWSKWISDKAPEANTDNFPLKSGFSVGDMVLVITPDGSGTVLPFFSQTKLGDVVIYTRDRRISGSEPIIHRVVGIVDVRDGRVFDVSGTLDCYTQKDFESKFIPYITNCQKSSANCAYRNFPEGNDFRLYITKGDNNKGTDQCGGILPVTDQQILARGWIRLPYLGWLKLALNRVFGLVLGIPFMLLGQG